jgi:hypothetical protein
MKDSPCRFDEIAGKITSLSMDVRTAEPAADLRERLKRFFGNGGLGLELKADGNDGLIFETGGNVVAAVLLSEGRKTRLRITTNGRTAAVRRFVTTLP